MKQIIAVDAQKPFGVQPHFSGIHILPDGARHIVGDHQPAPGRLGHALGKRGSLVLRQVVKTCHERGRHHEQPGADRVVVDQILADGGNALVPTLVIPQLDLGCVVEVENTRQVWIHGQHGQLALARLLRHIPDQVGRGDLIRHHQQGSLGDELARGQYR